MSAAPFTNTLMVEVSINEFSSKNLWSSYPSTVKVLVRYDPWYTTMLLNDPVLLITLPFASKVWVVVVVMLSGIENTYEVSFAEPTHTKPAWRVIVGVFPEVVKSKDTVAWAELLDLGTYPMFLARETTFSRTVAESKNDSFTTMLELNAVIYVLYANVSIKTEKLDPSKSKSVKSEFARR